MKRKVYTQYPPMVVVTLDQLTKVSHVGFIDNDGDKGFVAQIPTWEDNVGFGLLHAYREDTGNCNGILGRNVASSVKEAITGNSSSCPIVDIFVFDTRKELYQWLAE